jgi:anti-sigma B factor antagonist
VTRFTITRRDRGDAALLEFAGELDLAAADEVERAVRECGEAPVLILDLARVTFMDSTGLRLVLEADARARASGRRCIVVRGNGAVHRVITQSMLESRLDVVEQLSDLD